MATAANIGTFTVILTGLLTQYDVAETKRELKRHQSPNIYRLGHLFKAAQEAEAEVAHLKHRDDREALTRYHEALKKHFIYEHGQFALSPLRKLDKMMLAWLEKGTLPKYPTQRKENPMNTCTPCLEENPRARKTRDEYVVQGFYAHGWEDVTAEDSVSEIRKRYREYLENEPGTRFRWFKRRVPLKENPACLDNPCLGANPIGAGTLVVAALIAAGVAWVFWPKPAAAAPAAKQPALPPAPAAPIVLPSTTSADKPPAANAPAPVPTPAPTPTPQPILPAPPPPLGQCEKSIVIQYKLADSVEPYISVCRTLRTWSKTTKIGDNAWKDEGSYGEVVFIPLSAENIGLYYGDFGTKLQAVDYTEYYFATEYWIWTASGWCLQDMNRNY